MKKSTKVILISLACVILLLVSFSSLISNKITKLVLAELEESTHCVVAYSNIDVSIFSTFPHLGLELSDLSLEKTGDTLLYVEQIDGELSFRNLFSDELELRQLNLLRPVFNYSEDLIEQIDDSPASIANSSIEVSSTTQPSLLLNSIIVEEGTIRYSGKDSLLITCEHLNITSEGVLNEELSQLTLKLSVDEMNYSTTGLSLQDIPVDIDAKLSYRTQGKVWQFEENTFVIGQIAVNVEGQVALQEAPDFDLTFAAPHVSVKHVLALLPKAIFKDVDELDADGRVSLQGFVSGQYAGMEELPAYGVDFEVADVWLKYHDLPKRIETIGAHVALQHAEGTCADSTSIKVSDLEMLTEDNFVRGYLDISTPVSGVHVKGNLTSDMDFSVLKQLIPMEATALVGKINTDVSFDGKLSDLENENYEAFKASGYLSLSDYYMKNDDLPQGLSIKKAQLDFTPAKIKLKNFNATLGTSDLSLTGYLSNYFAYIFDNKPLKGELSLTSSFLNLNEFLDQEKPKATKNKVTANSKPKEKSAFIVPNNLNLVLTTKVSHLRLDNMDMKRFKGVVKLKESVLNLQQLSFNTLDGVVKVDGLYNSKQRNAVYTDLDLKLNNIEISKALQSFTTLRKMIPETQVTEGKISAELSYYVKFKADGEIDLNAISSKGNLTSPGLHVANNSALNGLAKQLKDPRYSDIKTSALDINYLMKDGKITFEPFDVLLVDKNVNAGGWYSFDNTLDLRIKTTVKAKELGEDVSKYIAMVADVNKSLPVTISLTGDAKQPTIKYDTREAIAIIRKDVTKNLNGDAVRSILKGFFK